MSEFKPLARAFYQPSAQVVAPRLLGHWLIRQTPAGLCGGAIVETEAYIEGDPACHGAPGPTARNRVMFGDPGYTYVYLIYGMHFCLNAVCCPPGTGEAVLIRAIEVDFGETIMRGHRAVSTRRELTSGPAKLCDALDIARNLNGVDLCDAKSPIFIAQNPQLESFMKLRGPVMITKRIGITKAADLMLRFYLRHSEFVSRRAS